MKVALLAGGLGTRLAEETEIKPKPMVEIGEKPILWHIMKSYAHYGFEEFFVALGYKGEVIKRYFMDYQAISSSFTIHLETGVVQEHSRDCENWTVHLMDTGADTMTGGRLKRLRPWLNDGTFCVTYGDGVGDVNIDELVRFHKKHGRLATITAVRPPARFGALNFDGDLVTNFSEKPTTGEGWINGGFMVMEPEALDYVTDDVSSLEVGVLERLAAEGQLAAYRHEGFWQCMDTLRDKRYLEQLWQEGRAPWKVWQDEWVRAAVPAAAESPRLRVV